ncbi:MAG: C39 family peptidase [Pseudomonadota bacterium]
MRSVPSIALLLLSALCAGCAQGPREPVRSLLEIRREGVVVQEWDLSCGAAALATVLTFAMGDPITERAVAQGMLRGTEPLKVKTRGGFSLLDMKRFTEARGFQADGYQDLSLADLLEFSYPIVPVNVYGADAHFVVVKGRTADGQILLGDPAFGNRRVTPAQFESMWQGGVGFVVSRS